MKRVSCLTLILFLFITAWAQPHTSVTENHVDSVISIGYATGSLVNVSGSIKKITEEQMNKEQIVNPLEALKGRVPGLAIKKSNNGTAALESVRMRGTTSLTSGNDPLIIVDGVIGGLEMLSSIYPADIESFTILSDASETSQYGSRGASGVIDIQTKKGQKGKTRLMYTGSIGVSNAYRQLDMLDADAYRRVTRQLHIPIVDKGYNTDFQKEIQQLGIFNDHNVAFYGGGEDSRYRMSLSYLSRDGVVMNESTKIFTANMSMTQSLLNNKVEIDLGSFGSVKRDEALEDIYKTFYSAATFNPTFPPFKNKETGEWDGVTSASFISNPMALMEVANDAKMSLLAIHGKVKFNWLPELSTELFGSYTYTVNERNLFLPTHVCSFGKAYRESKHSEMLFGNIMMTFNKDFGKHHLDALALGEISQETYSGFNTTVTNFATNAMGYHNLQAGALRPWDGTASFYEDPSLVSFLARVNYAFDNRYILTVVTRADASSKFGRNNKWGVFPSVSAAWNISAEDFMKRQNVIDNLKLRAGYGLSGNQAGIDSYTTMHRMYANGIAPVGNMPIVTFEALRNVNPDLKWEVKKSLNFGLDMTAFKNRLMLTIDYYNALITDMLYEYSVNVPPFSYNKLLANFGSMRNSGVELSIGVTPVLSKDIELNVNVNCSFQKNKLISLSGMYGNQFIDAPEYTPIVDVYGAGISGGNNNIVYQIVGQPLGVFYLPKCDGLVSDGKGGYNYNVVDLNGKDINLEDGEDRYIAGQAIPKVMLGSNIMFRYKQFDLSLQINGAFGHKIYNGTSLSYMNMNSLPTYNVLSEAPKKMIRDQVATDYWLEDGDYVNFDYLTVGWTMPKMEGKWVKGLRLVFTINNLGTISGYSGLTPMINSSVVDNTLGVDDKCTHPLARTYTLSLSLDI